MNRHAGLRLIGWFFLAHTAWSTPLGGGGKVFLASPDFTNKKDCEEAAGWVKRKGGDPSECWHSATPRDNAGGLPQEVAPSSR